MNISLFEQIKQVGENNIAFWSARDFSKALGYSEYRHFLPVLEKAKKNCENDGQNMAYHFEEYLEMIEIGKGGKREVDSVKLSRYACLLIVQNVSSSKKISSEIISYFSENKPVISGYPSTGLRKLSTQDETTNFLLYTSPDGNIKVEAILHNETIWLTQEQMASIFDVQKPAVSKHLSNVFESYELEENRCVSILETHLPDGRTYLVKYYNLDAIISVGYRVNSTRATQFRIWATNVLREYILKGFAMDDNRLKNGRFFGKDYFQELLERVRSIRSSERRIYQKITDIFAECSIDYNKNSIEANEFYATVQNRFHYAISGRTAAEIIYREADANKEFMGLHTWKYAPNGRILKSDVVIAKNYLTEEKIKELERTVSSYFDYIERQIERRHTFQMSEFAESVNRFLEFNDYKILHGKGKISHKQAEEKAIKEYEEFNKKQPIESDFDRIIKQLQNKNDIE
jgi:DNA-directed RNA polymerase subunit N (RpoN/RPB10)